MKLKKGNLCPVTLSMIVVLITACADRAAEEPAAAVAAPAGEKAVIAVVESPLMKQGKRVFSSCASCHTINARGASTIGPNLSGILGSAAGSKSDFDYSESLQNSGIVWTEETLDGYIQSPATYLPGGTMTFAGVHDESDRNAVLTYLIEKTSDENADPLVPSDQGDDVAAWE
jgi:cytochrome c